MRVRVRVVLFYTLPKMTSFMVTDPALPGFNNIYMNDVLCYKWWRDDDHDVTWYEVTSWIKKCIIWIHDLFSPGEKVV